jgi:membrane associated rhomboid family serine protease
MFSCPHCDAGLCPAQNEYGKYYVCRKCEGRLVPVSLLLQIIDEEHVDWFWGLGRRGFGDKKRPCPVCQKYMYEVPAGPHAHASNLDVCRECSLVWFDPPEYQEVISLPKIEKEDLKYVEMLRSVPASEEKMRSCHIDPRAEGDIILAMEKIKDIPGKVREGQLVPDEWWKMIPVCLGLPVRITTHEINCMPWMTWGLAALTCLISIVSFANLKPSVMQLGMIPAEMFRTGGLTLISNFFIHGGWFHLIGNMYFLLLFGDKVEDFLGKGRFLLLIFLATITGNFIHAGFFPDSQIPLIGASGGMSGLIVFYLLKFPRVKMGFLFRFWWHIRWVKISALVFLLLWIFQQAVVIFRQMGGGCNISGLGHAGGASVGFIFFLLYRKRKISI